MGPVAERFRKKPVEIEAVELTAHNAKDICDWMQSALQRSGSPDYPGFDHTGSVYIHTLEGTMRADIGDWIIRGVQGEFYPCKPDIFAATYDRV